MSSINPSSWYLNGAQSFIQLTFKSEEVKSHPGMYSYWKMMFELSSWFRGYVIYFECASYTRTYTWMTCLGTKARLFSFNIMQSRVVTGLLTRHNTLRRHLHLMGLIESPLCRKCGAEDETSAHILCRCEALASLRHAYLGSSFLEPENIKNVSLGAIWNFGKVTGLP
jgi:hypothetical protein